VPRRGSQSLVLAAILFGAVRSASAQDLEPRAYIALPVDATFLIAGGGRSSGGVLLDPSLPVENAQATLGIINVGVGHSFDLFGRMALLVAGLPGARAVVTGDVRESAQRASRVGLADSRVKLSVNLLGGAAKRARELATAPRAAVLGVSLTTGIPTGQYDRTKLVNLGSHRWSFKPEIGLTVPIGPRWRLEGYAGVWMFTPNNAYYPGSVRQTQDHVVAVQTHATYSIRPQLWVAADATWYRGGTTTVGAERKDNLQSASRIGAAISVPIGRRQSLKAAYSTGATTRFGADFNTLAVAWQMTWVKP